MRPLRTGIQTHNQHSAGFYGTPASFFRIYFSHDMNRPAAEACSASCAISIFEKSKQDAIPAEDHKSNLAAAEQLSLKMAEPSHEP